MYRNLFAVLATVSMGVGTASAAGPANEAAGQNLEQRVLGAQAALDAALKAPQDPAAKAGSEKLAQYYGYGGYRPYRPFGNFHNFCNYYYQSC